MAARGEESEPVGPREIEASEPALQPPGAPTASGEPSQDAACGEAVESATVVDDDSTA